MKKFTLVTAASLLIGASSQAALFANGSFETGTLPDADNWVRTGNDNQVKISGSIGSFNPGPSNGSRYVHFGSGGALGGSIAQTFDTLAGATYAVSFDFGTYGPGAGAVGLASALRVSVNNVLASTQDYNDPTGSTYSSTAAVSPTYNDSLNRNFTFTASSTSTTLTFLDITSGGSNYDIGLDNITVNMVPEPSTALLGMLGSLALLRRRR